MPIIYEPHICEPPPPVTSNWGKPGAIVSPKVERLNNGAIWECDECRQLWELKPPGIIRNQRWVKRLGKPEPL